MTPRLIRFGGWIMQCNTIIVTQMTIEKFFIPTATTGCFARPLGNSDTGTFRGGTVKKTPLKAGDGLYCQNIT